MAGAHSARGCGCLPLTRRLNRTAATRVPPTPGVLTTWLHPTALTRAGSTAPRERGFQHTWCSHTQLGFHHTWCSHAVVVPERVNAAARHVSFSADTLRRF